MTDRRSRRAWRTAALVGVCVAALTSCGGDGGDVLQVEAAIDGRPLDGAGPRNPIPLRPTAESTLSLDVSNTSDRPVEIRRVRIEGEMLAIDFLTYDVRARTVVEPGDRRRLEVPLDFFDLDRQATGYLRAHLRLYDADRRAVSDDEFAVDIRGSLLSTMGVFAMALVALTVIGAARALRDAKRRVLPENRFQRGLRFLVPGVGMGLLLSVGFSILRIFPLPTTGWVLLTLIPAGAAFAAGYALTKAADDEPAEEDELDLEDDELASLAASKSSAT